MVNQKLIRFYDKKKPNLGAIRIMVNKTPFFRDELSRYKNLYKSMDLQTGSKEWHKEEDNPEKICLLK